MVKQNRKNKVLIVYTGGTIGMVQDEHGSLHPFAMERIYDGIPLLHRVPYQIDSMQLENIIDSSNMTPSFWSDIASVIEKEYDNYDGFVVLHGTDTMAYTASALSYMFEHLSKPIVLTGSQLPLGMLRSDGRDNIICALEVAAGKEITVPEVCIFFQSRLLRGNRSTKVSADQFDAFYSYNLPSLAKVGINFDYNESLIRPMPDDEPLIVRKEMETRIAVLKLFPGITSDVVNAVIRTPNLQGLIVETYGSGNAPTEPWFISALEEGIQRGLTILDITQCKSGAVKLKQYAASYDLDRVGVLSGQDMTIEAAVTKMMYLLGNYREQPELMRRLFTMDLRGEVSES
ncbi:MAG: type I asparaginase [Bacteroidales bacterium]|nr:type I asparaginase [Bacteroidales bacterium]